MNFMGVKYSNHTKKQACRLKLNETAFVSKFVILAFVSGVVKTIHIR
jgi:hypothetical protein